MIIYKRWKFVKLGFNRYRVTAPDGEFIFDIIIRGGLKEILERVNTWMEVKNDNYRTETAGI